jgi:soluble lytic murein transglycosylase-like protein
MMTDFSTIDARISLARKYGVKYLLDTALICGLVDHESSWNPFAIRYEPAFYAEYIQNMRGLTPTEMTARAQSWGLGQIMGQTAREFGFAGRFLSELCDPDTGLDFACKKLSKCLTDSGNDVDKALQRYNGGADPDYHTAVKALMPKYFGATL